MLRGINMRNKRLISLGLMGLLVFISSLFMINKADAVSLQYQVVQPNGQISHADQYMDKPANVIIQNGKYYVSMTSSVPAWIGSHPVTYTSINNGDGQIVNNAHGASFKFSTTNLNKLIPVTMHLDVKVANVNMDTMVYLKFINVPALNSANGGSSQAATGDGTNADGNASDSADASGDANSADNGGNADGQTGKVTIKKPVKLNKKGEPKKSSNSNDGDSVIYPDKDKKSKQDTTHYVAIASGTVVIVAVVAGVIYYRKRNQ